MVERKRASSFSCVNVSLIISAVIRRDDTCIKCKGCFKEWYMNSCCSINFEQTSQTIPFCCLHEQHYRSNDRCLWKDRIRYFLKTSWKEHKQIIFIQMEIVKTAFRRLRFNSDPNDKQISSLIDLSSREHHFKKGKGFCSQKNLSLFTTSSPNLLIPGKIFKSFYKCVIYVE